MSERKYELWFVHKERPSEGPVEQPKFPQDYTHVANVTGESVREICEMADDWDWSIDNPKAELLMQDPREMQPDDVLIDQDGRAFRYDGYCNRHLEIATEITREPAAASPEELFRRILKGEIEPDRPQKQEKDKDYGRDI